MLVARWIDRRSDDDEEHGVDDDPTRSRLRETRQARAIEELSFDDALAELQRTVTELETGGQPLEAAIALYERGVALQARCERLIGDAELRVQQLVARAGGALETREVRTDEDGDARQADRALRTGVETRDRPASGLHSGSVHHPVRRRVRTSSHTRAIPPVSRPNRRSSRPLRSSPHRVPSVRIAEPCRPARHGRLPARPARREIRETIIRTVADTGGHLGSSLGVVELDDRPPPAARVATRPDRVGHGHQAYPHKLLTGRLDRFRHAALARWCRWLPAPDRVGARRVRRRACRNRAVDRRGLRRGARPAPWHGAHRGRGRRRGADERPVARGAQRHRPAPDPDAHRRQR